MVVMLHPQFIASLGYVPKSVPFKMGSRR
jgi:hypothetical protein